MRMSVKAIKKAVVTALLLSLTVLLLALPACTARDRFTYTNEAFLDRILARTEEGDVEIHTLDAYYYDGWYYYRVDQTYMSPLTGEPTDITLVYYGQGTVKAYLNPNWDDFGDLLYRFEHYRVAEIEGEHRAFSEGEIASLVAEYYEKNG